MHVLDEHVEVQRVVWRGLVCVSKVVRIPSQYVSLVVPAADEDQEADGTTKRMNAKLENLANEISILRRLRHPNLVMFLGACFYENQPPLTLLEYCSGGSLEQAIDSAKTRKKHIKAATKLRYLQEIALAMNYLHW